MIEIKIKPFSVNKAWQGRRFATKEYKAYESELLELLPDLSIPEGKLFMHVVWGHSNAGLADWDNPMKPFQDILQKRYDFNDCKIYRALVDKIKVGRGEDYIKFILLPLDESINYIFNLFGGK